MDSPVSSNISGENLNAMNILQQFSQLMFLQSLAAGKNSSFDPSMFGFPDFKQSQQIPTSPTQVTTTTLPPISPKAEDASDALLTISKLLSSHQNLKNEFSSPSSPTTFESSPFKKYNNDFGFMDIFSSASTPSSTSTSSARLYKVHVNRESSKPLQDWMIANITNPYPTNRDVQQLSNATGFTYKQIRNWFTNSRRRYEQTCGTNGIPWIKKVAPKVCRKINLSSESSPLPSSSES
uniref:Homeobox domain-containing protein n=1 Tax=Panagrolaimus davidi TaxID=227884 RepID=A0A914PTG8_9BILA